MVLRLCVLFTLAALMLASGVAHASPRYSAWSNVTLFTTANTADFEFANAISKDGLRFYFQRGDAFASAEDIWVTEREKEGAPWGAPIKLAAPVNSSFNERAAFESPDGHWLFFASNRLGGKGEMDLYVSWRQHTHDSAGWQAPTNLDSLNTTGFDSGATAFEDELAGGLRMYFVSNPAGGQNNAVDIYESVQQPDGSWAPRQLVPALNSPFNEGRPYVRHDGLEIYFNSTRDGGQQDIWVSTRGSIADAWGVPQRADGLNTPAPDITPALSWDGRTLFFASLRTGNAEVFTATRAKITGKP